MTRLVKLSTFCETGSGGTPSRQNAERYFDGEIPWVKSGELRGEVITKTKEKITNIALVESSAKLVPAGSILLAMYGATVGRVAMLGINAATSQAICAIRPDKSQAETSYVYHALRAKVPNFIAMAVGGAQPNISQSMIRDTMIKLPSIEEQRLIANTLDKANAISKKRQESINLIDELLRSVFLDMFGDPVTNPKGWSREQLCKLTSKIGSGATPRGGDSVYKSSGISFIRSLNVHDRLFLRKDLAYLDMQQAVKLSNVSVMAGDLLLNITGASVARACLVPDHILPARVNQHVCIIRPIGQLIPEFLEAQMVCESVKKLLLGIGESMGATRQAITKAQLESFYVIVPPISEQKRFTNIVAKIKEQKLRMQVFQTESELLFQSLQQQAFV